MASLFKKQEYPLYERYLPSTGEKILFHAFTVKEQRILLLAQESGDPEQILVAAKQIVQNCVQNDIDVDILPYFDIEFLFLNISAKSGGEILDFNIKCSDCGTPNEYSINLSELEIVTPDKKNNVIKFSSGDGITFKFPTLDIFSKLPDKDDPERYSKMMDIYIACIENIFTEEEISYPKDLDKQDIIDTIEGLLGDDFNKIHDWVSNFPKVSHDIKFVCNKCEHSNHYVVEGLKSFFQ